MDVLDKLSVEEYNKKYPRTCTSFIIGASKQSAFDTTPYGLALQIRAELNLDKEHEGGEEKVIENQKKKSALDIIKKIGCVRLICQKKTECDNVEEKK
ncbi:hypothetical protein GCK72_007036 [Caenorhabditis remanei]|uniref:Uncharacterized protein n=1 Tax=Caenorhabditis remanei TaxID=31234 RepID=A0A6A5HGX6_CAERE|nr:hypothetical protein GCK72_007036 [Caenorhabditis remanei]KAF1767078.1 hypothetical protein GCK72_007036 [Caenorhabditis remanei]